MTDQAPSFSNVGSQTVKGYELQELIGEGGFGSVYRAYQPAVRREVAIKAILPEFANQPDFIRRFEIEAQIIAHLEHIHIVPLYDYWRDANGAFLVMRWLRGGSLRAALEKDSWPLDEIPHLFDQITSALYAAHKHGVIHRDIKPDNILLDDEKNVYLADFGIAKNLKNLNNSVYVIEEKQGTLIGSPYYVSPEQIRGEQVSPQSDIYSLGIMLYEIVTGKNPFYGLPLSTLITKHLQEPLPHLGDDHPHLPEALNRVIEIATNKDPAQRYSSVLTFNLDLRKSLATDEMELNLQEEDVPATNQVHFATEELAQHDTTNNIVTRIDVAAINPFKGLRAFQEADSKDFSGRDALIERLVDSLRADSQRRRFLSVIGPSGSGKSSVVKAGLLPRLRQNAILGSKDWFIVEMTPGTHPLEELEAALLRIAVNPPATLLAQLTEDDRGLVRAIKRILPPNLTTDTELLLVIDQFEEVFTLTEEETERLHFLNMLTTAARDPSSRLRVIITLRADFYDRPLLYTGFGEILRESTEVVLPMMREELERAIVNPAERAGLRLENGLITSILIDVDEQPGMLPLLQFALTELFERRKGQLLTLQAYKDIGGVSGALARRADELYGMLDEAGRKVTRQMFLRLITLNEGAEDTRRRVRIDELLSLRGDANLMQKVLDLFGKYRLLTFDRDPTSRTPTVEVAHEALIRRWDLLRSWLQENRDGLHIQHRLTTASEEWMNAAKDMSYVASGTRLDQFETWSKETELALTENESQYLAASLAERDQKLAAEETRKAQERTLQHRSQQFRSALIVVLGIATLGALILSSIALNQSQSAQQNASTATFAQGDALVEAAKASTAAAVAESNAADAHSLAFASGAQLALSNHNTDLAILLALEANKNGHGTIQTLRTLAEAAYAPGTRRIYTGHEGRVTTVGFSPDGTRAVSGGRDNSVIIWDVATGQILDRLQGHTNWVWDVAFSPDGKSILSASQDKTLILWDAKTGQQLQQLKGHTDIVRSVAYSADGKTAISASQDATLILWDLVTGKQIRQFKSGSPIFDVAFSNSGFTAISSGQGNVITLWNVQTGEPMTQFGVDGEGHKGDIWTLAYLPDESGMLTGGDDGSIILWSFESGQPIRRFTGHSARVTNLAISADGKQAVSVSEDNSVLVWSIATAAVNFDLTGHTAPVYGVAFAPDSSHVLSASWDGTLRLWDLQNGSQTRLLNPKEGAVLAVAYSPDGKQALSGLSDGSIVLWDLTNGQEIRHFIGHTGAVNALNFSPDGSMFISGSDDLSLILWDVATGSIVIRFGGSNSNDGHSDAIWSVAFSPNGKLAASGSRDNTVIIWDIQSGKPIKRLFGHTFRVTDVVFSPDGSMLLSSSFDNLLILWDVQTGHEIRRFEGHTDWVRSAAFSPDGKNIVSASADNTLILWDVASGKRLRKFEGHTAQIYSVAISPDGQYALSASADSSIILWDLKTGAQVRRFIGHTDDVKSVRFSPDSRFALSGSSDGTIRQWQISLSLESLVHWTQNNRYIRELTCTERELYGVEPLCTPPTPIVVPNSV